MSPALQFESLFSFFSDEANSYLPLNMLQLSGTQHKLFTSSMKSALSHLHTGSVD